MKDEREVLNNLKVGIIGCGHLGQAIAQTLVACGLEKKNLFISYGGNSQTFQKLVSVMLDSCIATNQRIFEEAGIILITIKPQDLAGFKENVIQGKALVVSCMAGVPLELIQKILGIEAYRMMLSGPDTILSGKGVASMYPPQEHLRMLLKVMRLTEINAADENDINVFTAGVCLTAALLKTGNANEQKTAIDRIKRKYPLLSELYIWAVSALPDLQNEQDREAYISHMITKGGVTDAIIKSLSGGEPLDAALIKGISRTGEISNEIAQQLNGIPD
jgi:pyrroline-5-carboxylate reductase